MKSKIFYTDIYQKIQIDVLNFIEGSPDFLSVATAKSPRAVGDAIQDLLAENFDVILGDLCSEYSTNFARRAMADLAFQDEDNFYYVVDVKTHRTDTKFNMPNLISVERLSRFYQDDNNYFVILMASYTIQEIRAVISNIRFVPIEFLGWDCLTIGALGWGQIQISNSNNITINSAYSRKKWMLELCDVMLEFYPKEILKIGKRVSHFEKIKEFWLSKPDQ
jgi:hypothetical protein